MLSKNQEIVQKCPKINNKFKIKAEKIRNSIAHPKESLLLPINKEELFPFIQWIEELQLQLYNYIKIHHWDTTHFP